MTAYQSTTGCCSGIKQANAKFFDSKATCGIHGVDSMAETQFFSYRSHIITPVAAMYLGFRKMRVVCPFTSSQDCFGLYRSEKISPDSRNLEQGSWRPSRYGLFFIGLTGIPRDKLLWLVLQIEPCKWKRQFKSGESNVTIDRYSMYMYVHMWLKEPLISSFVFSSSSKCILGGLAVIWSSSFNSVLCMHGSIIKDEKVQRI